MCCSFIHLAETTIIESNIDDVFESNIGKDSDWITDSVIDHNINISKYNPLASSGYTKLPKELDHPRKVLINIQNIDGHECFKWFLVRCLVKKIY